MRPRYLAPNTFGAALGATWPLKGVPVGVGMDNGRGERALGVESAVRHGIEVSWGAAAGRHDFAARPE